jgi:hypothetical protein
MGAIDRVQPANPCRFKSSCQAKEIGLVIASSKMPAQPPTVPFSFGSASGLSGPDSC